MVNKIWTGVIVAGLIWFAYLYGLSQATREPVMSCDKIQAEIDVYVEYMARAGELRGSMTVDDFRQYHQLKAELARRCVVIEPQNLS